MQEDGKVKIGAFDTYIYYGKAYLNAVKILYEKAKFNSSSVESEQLIYPFLFLMHHSLELFIKAILTLELQIKKDSSSIKIENHNLANLLIELEKITKLDSRFSQKNIKYMRCFITDFSKLSCDGVEYRYPFDKTLEVKNLQIESSDEINDFVSLVNKWKNSKNKSTCLLIHNTIKNEWFLFKKENPSAINIDAEYDILNELKKETPDKETLKSHLQKSGLLKDTMFPNYKEIKVDILFKHYLKIVEILERWFYLLLEVEDEYFKYCHIDDLSPFQIRKITKYLPGYFDINVTETIGVLARKFNEIELDNDKLNRIIDVIQREPMLSPYLGSLFVFHVLSIEKINLFLALDIGPVKQRDAVFKFNYDKIFRFLKKEDKFFKKILQLFTKKEIAELLTLNSLGDSFNSARCYKQIFEQFTGEIDSELNDEILKAYVRKLSPDKIFRGLEKVGYICIYPKNKSGLPDDLIN